MTRRTSPHARSCSLTDALAGYWANAGPAELPPAVKTKAKQHILDTIAVAVAGARTPVARKVRRGSELDQSHGCCTVWGTDTSSVSASAAAVCNGTSAHARELDDGGAGGHPGSVVVPAVFAAGEAADADGISTLVAVVAGYDVGGRVLAGVGGYLAHTSAGWHSTGTCGTFSAAAGAAKILGLDDEVFRDALGIAGTYTGGTWAFHQDGAATKRFHPGRAAETGVKAALLANAGLTGPAYVLESEWGGFLQSYGPKSLPDAVISDLGIKFAILGASIKPYACCAAIHSALDTIFRLKAQERFEPDDVSNVLVHVSTETSRMVGGTRGVHSILDAQFSLPYSIAVALESGRADLSQYDPLRLDNPRVRILMDRVRIVEDLPPSAGETAELEVSITGGTTLRGTTKHVTGSPTNPLPDRTFDVKMRSLLEPVLGQTRTSELIAAVESLDRLDRIRTLTSLLRVEPQ